MMDMASRPIALTTKIRFAALGLGGFLLEVVYLYPSGAPNHVRLVVLSGHVTDLASQAGLCIRELAP